MKKFENILCIITIVLGVVVLGWWFITLGEYAGIVMAFLGFLVIGGLLASERETIIIEIETEE